MHTSNIESQTRYDGSDYAKHSEGPVARGIEEQTAKLPSDLFLWGALGAIGLSLALQVSGRAEKSNFVGQWAPTILILGMYNKLVKLHGSDGNQVPAHTHSDSRFGDGRNLAM